MHESLLVELLTEELPPRSLTRLAAAFAENLRDGLAAEALLGPDSRMDVFATPRRLAVRFTAALDRQADRIVERRGPAVAAGLEAEGRPTRALEGFARSAGVDIAALGRVTEGKNEYFVARIARAGQPLAALLPDLLAATVKKLPIARMMRWGDSDAQFVRPVHGLVVLHGGEVLPVAFMGHAAGRTTRGHRFLSQGVVELSHADRYETEMQALGQVIVSFSQRRAVIEKQLRALEAAHGARLYQDEWCAADFPAADPAAAARAADSLGNASLLDEVTALVEYPAVYPGHFDEAFLSVPIECLTLTMKQNQKYFPAAGLDGRLLPFFAVVSNILAEDPSAITHGNERVLRARLADARFFFEQDLATPLADRVEALTGVIYHNKLGTQMERVARLRALASAIAGEIGADAALADRAARLCKADLLTGMVGEFPELQGVMGHYYALRDGEDPRVAAAIEAHYHPRFAGDVLPADPIGAAVALADKLDILAGIFGIGLVPTGDKDPFGLRRHALGILRILAEMPLALDLRALIRRALVPFAFADAALEASIYAFMLDRLRSLLRDAGGEVDEIEAIVAPQPAVLDSVLPRMSALRDFRSRPAAASLAAANKRIQNILRSDAAADIDAAAPVAPGLLADPAEKALLAGVTALEPRVGQLVADHRFVEALAALAEVREPVDAFFDSVMVMCEDTAVRANRVRLLARLRTLLNQVADISRLAA